MNAYILCRESVGQTYASVQSYRVRRQREAKSWRHPQSERWFRRSTCRKAHCLWRFLVSHIGSKNSEQTASA
jgi:hypothetical protein